MPGMSGSDLLCARHQIFTEYKYKSASGALGKILDRLSHPRMNLLFEGQVKGPLAELTVRTGHKNRDNHTTYSSDWSLQSLFGG